ncbi:AAA family ATPase [Variovorax sp. J22P168]|uniref:AAA family ATPase n=1 Tax=Variovorax jilinensis TaxID=3053513 RepID=UPI002578C951|nr:AAA family ATPase [Variovorax sp. J22P168]MDM0015097.1 AAA family ATPase [Variovorax sp. J22P168]
MQISQIALDNYKSFNDKQILDFESGFNLIVGGNNSGKSSVLEVLDLVYASEPHRSPKTLPAYGDAVRGNSKMEVAFSTTTQELGRLFAPQSFRLPVSQPYNGTAIGVEYLQSLMGTNAPLAVRFSSTAEGRSLLISSGTPFEGLVSEWQNPSIACAAIGPGPVGEFLVSDLSSRQIGGEVDSFYQQFKKRIYKFGAMRRPGSECSMTNSPILDREAIQLPYFINQLQTSDAHGHRMLCEWVARILPSIAWVQSTPTGNTFSLQCLPTPPESQRSDLATPLARMGSGIGNIIAILYVVLTARDPQVIAIDEPNAFLHPRALRELLAILETEGRQHQYLLTAHSADVLTAVNTKTISFLELKEYATVATQTRQADLHSLQGELSRLGLRVTDLHAKDSVLWVEGQSEELVMPELLRFACPEIAAGTAVLRVEHTGTFESKRKRSMAPEEVASIYARLSGSSGLVPPMVCILLDAEKRKPKQRQEIENRSGGKLRFLDRRMLENYLLEPNAIHAALNEIGAFFTVSQIESTLAELVPNQDPEVLEDIDGAAVLSELFSSISEATQEFRKTRDVPALVTWLLENKPESLTALKASLRRIAGLV